jgi:hypothetical protein
MASFGMLRRVALVRTYVSEELSASIIRVTRIGEVGTTLAITSIRLALLVILMMEALLSSETSVLQEPHSVTSQKTSFFIPVFSRAVLARVRLPKFDCILYADMF